jgi:ketosteroid isomerase-like protein
MASDNHEAIISDWIAAMNTHDVKKFLSFLTRNAVLDDPSVGEYFDGPSRIAEYYERYFVGYHTTTSLVSVAPVNDSHHVEVHFTGDFPGGETRGTFDVTFVGEKISFIRADLA